MGVLPRSVGPVSALLLASLVWGTSDVASKIALDTFPPATLAALRFAVASAILLPLARRQRCARVPARIVLPLGVLGVALAFLLQNTGLERTAAANASLLQGAVPVVTIVLAATLLRERLDRDRIVAVALALVGVLAVTLPGDGGLSAPGVGDVIVLASTVCFAAFFVLGRRAFPVYGTLPVLSGMACWGTAALIPLAAVELRHASPGSIEPGAAALVLYLGAGCSALTYGLWGFALRHLEASKAAPFDALVPVIGVATAVLVLREAPLGWHLLGGGLVVSGIFFVLRTPATPPTSPARRALRRPDAQEWSGALAPRAPERPLA